MNKQSSAYISNNSEFIEHCTTPQGNKQPTVGLLVPETSQMFTW